MPDNIPNPFFTIIIPTYNRAHMLSKAIESVLAQTFHDWELIIVDDGSTDNTKDVVTAYTDSRIKYIYQENAERSAARNKGIENAKGEYISFLDSDDYYLDNRLDGLKNFIVINKSPKSLMFTEKKVLLNNIETISQIDDGVFKRENNFNIAMDLIIHSQQVCVESSILKNYRFNTELKVGEDLELWLRILKDFSLMFIPEQPTVVIVEHEDRTVAKSNYLRFFEQKKSVDVIFKKNQTARKLISNRKKNSLYSYVFFGMSKYYMSVNQRTKALQYILKSVFKNLFCDKQKHKIYIFVNLFKFWLSTSVLLNRIEYGNNERI